MDLKWMLAAVWWCHLSSVTWSVPGARLARQATGAPDVIQISTGSNTGGVCNPAQDPLQCRAIVFTAETSVADHTECICNYVPMLFEDGEEGVERTDLATDTVGSIVAAFEVPEIHCLPPTLPDGVLNQRSTAIQFNIRLTYDNTEYTDVFTLGLLIVPCVQKTEAGGETTYIVQAGHCVIDGKCIKEGETREDNPAQSCVAADDKFSWTGPELTTVAETEATTKEATTKPATTVAVITTPIPDTTPLRETIKVTVAKQETTTTQAQTPPPKAHSTDKATGAAEAGFQLDMVALLGSIIVLEILLIIIVVMVIVHIKHKNSK